MLPSALIRPFPSSRWLASIAMLSEDSTIRRTITSGLAVLCFLVLPCRSDIPIQCVDIEFPVSNNPNCLTALNSFFHSVPRSDLETPYHWVAQANMLADSFESRRQPPTRVGHLLFQGKDRQWPECELHMWPQLDNVDDVFTYQSMGDVVEEIYIRCTLWGGGMGTGSVGPKGLFMLMIGVMAEPSTAGERPQSTDGGQLGREDSVAA